jgi:hypothetical protein
MPNHPVPPENILRWMDPADRQKHFGAAGLTAAEATRKAEWRHELKQQKKFRQWLHLNSIRYSNPRSDKKSTVPSGVLDFIVFCPRAEILIIEFKSPTHKKLTPEQEKFWLDVSRWGHKPHRVFWADEAIKLVKERLINEQTDPDVTGPGTLA